FRKRRIDQTLLLLPYRRRRFLLSLPFLPCPARGRRRLELIAVDISLDYRHQRSSQKRRTRTVDTRKKVELADRVARIRDDLCRIDLHHRAQSRTPFAATKGRVE